MRDSVIPPSPHPSLSYSTEGFGEVSLDKNSRQEKANTYVRRSREKNKPEGEEEMPD